MLAGLLGRTVEQISIITEKSAGKVVVRHRHRAFTGLCGHGNFHNAWRDPLDDRRETRTRLQIPRNRGIIGLNRQRRALSFLFLLIGTQG